MKNDDSWLESIDGLKGICAFLIAFVWHYQHFVPLNTVPFYPLFRISSDFGLFYVEYFFLLSGFGMMYGYGRRVTGREISFYAFMGRRIRKIYPLFLLTTGIVAVLQALILRKTGSTFVYPNHDLYHLVLNLLLLQNGILETGWSMNSPSWTISVLMPLYVLFYAVNYFSRNQRRIYCFFGGCALLGCVVILSRENLPVLNPLMGRGLSCFSIGVLLYGIYERRDRFESRKVGYMLMLLPLSAYVLLRCGKGKYAGDLQMLTILGIAPAVVYGLLVVPAVKLFFSWKPFVWLGKISMAVYLFHFPIQCLFKATQLYLYDHIDYTSLIIWMSYVILTLILSALYERLASERLERWLLRQIRENG